MIFKVFPNLNDSIFKNRSIVWHCRAWRCWVPCRSVPHIFSAAHVVGWGAAWLCLWGSEMLLMFLMLNLALPLLILSILSPETSTKISLKDGERGWMPESHCSFGSEISVQRGEKQMQITKMEKCGMISLFFVFFPFSLSTTFIPWGLVRFKCCKDRLDSEQRGSCPDQEVASCFCLCSFSTPHWFPLEHQAVDFISWSVTVQPIPYPLSHPTIKSMFLCRD